MRATTWILPFFLLLFLSACGSARMLRGSTGGGQISMSGSYMAAADEARTLMAEHCDGAFVVVTRRTSARTARVNAAHPAARGSDLAHVGSQDMPGPHQQRFAFRCVTSASKR